MSNVVAIPPPLVTRIETFSHPDNSAIMDMAGRAHAIVHNLRVFLGCAIRSPHRLDCRDGLEDLIRNITTANAPMVSDY